MSARPDPFATKSSPPAAAADPVTAAETAIRRLRRQANHGFWILASFLLLSFAALENFAFLPSFTPAFREKLGAGPAPGFINMLLVVYLFSAVIITLVRMMNGEGKTGGIAHLGYLGAFYAFFHLSGALADNLWAVVGSGITILCLEAYQLWNYCQEEIGQEQEKLDLLRRRISNQASWPEDPPA